MKIFSEIGKAKSLDLTVRAQVVALKEISGLSLNDIAKKLKKSRHAVQNACKKHLESNTFTDKPRCGRPRMSTLRQDRTLKRLALTNRRLSSKILSRQWHDVGVPLISPKSVRRHLNKQGLNGHVAIKKPFTSKINQQKRLKFAHEFLHFSVTDWQTVLWSDESKFNLAGNDSRRIFVWRRQNESYKPECLQGTVKHGGGSIMVWGFMSSFGPGQLHQVEGIMNGAMYRDILRKHLLPSATALFPATFPWIFQQDNDPKHTSKVAKDFLAANGVQVLHWPPQSPDLNPIENMWDEIDRRCAGKRASNKHELWDFISAAWTSITAVDCKKLVDTMPARLAEVIKNKGGPTHY